MRSLRRRALPRILKTKGRSPDSRLLLDIPISIVSAYLDFEPAEVYVLEVKSGTQGTCFTPIYAEQTVDSSLGPNLIRHIGESKTAQFPTAWMAE